MRNIKLVSLMIIGCLATGQVWSQEALMKQAQALFKPLPATAPKLPGNAATPAKVELGKMLYFEPRLSESHSINCNSCHMVGMGGVDLQETSLGHRWQHGGRNAPTVYNAVFDVAQFWDGRAKDLEQQAGGPLINPVEMDTTEAHVVEQLKGIPGYAGVFAKAFPGTADPITFDNVRKAIALFEATLITPNAPFDRFLKGDDKALDAHAERRLDVVHQQGLCRMPQRHQHWRQQVCSLRRCGTSRRRHSAACRQGPLRSYQDRQRRIRFSCAFAAQHRTDRTVFPHRQGVGPASGCRHYGQQSARCDVER